MVPWSQCAQTAKARREEGGKGTRDTCPQALERRGWRWTEGGNGVVDKADLPRLELRGHLGPAPSMGAPIFWVGLSSTLPQRQVQITLLDQLP
jgi:hypothetical protein